MCSCKPVAVLPSVWRMLKLSHCYLMFPCVLFYWYQKELYQYFSVVHNLLPAKEKSVMLSWLVSQDKKSTSYYLNELPGQQTPANKLSTFRGLIMLVRTVVSILVLRKHVGVVMSLRSVLTAHKGNCKHENAFSFISQQQAY